ncbi:TPA: hypothetical protein ACPSKB_002655 [Legionella feeleii]|uniref:Oligosaccharide repeat unit polymerase n=1 Tax=Legionella feeleii TaxID=453 RepID=A0A378IUN1_9GAMM|nr:hypothetical protein [Legionella feeleii]STX38938.1 Uncharacterised protein [Legionella feeleii]
MTRFFFIRPSYFLYLIWLILLVVFYIQPIEYLKPVGFGVWGFILGGLLVFTLGEQSARFFPVRQEAAVAVSTQHLNRVVLFSSLLGLLGILCLTYDKLVLSGLDYSHGLAFIRELRVQQLDKGVDVHRSFWLYLGYPFFSFSYPALMLLVINAAEIKPSVARFAQLSASSPIIYALLYGGRMPIFILFFLLLTCCFIRKFHGKTFFPREHALLAKLLMLGICFALYSNHVLVERRQNSNQTSYNDFMNFVVQESWGAAPKQWITTLIEDDIVSKDTAMTLMTNSMYLTNGVVSLSKIIDNHKKYTPYWGTYQVGILSPLLRVFYANNTVLSTMKENMVDTNIYGFYTTAWGAWFLDFGLIGAILFIAVWGYVSGTSAKYARDPARLGSQLILAYCYTSIVVSIFNGPLGVSNSFLIFVSLVVVAVMLRGIGVKPVAQSRLSS